MYLKTACRSDQFVSNVGLNQRSLGGSDIQNVRYKSWLKSKHGKGAGLYRTESGGFERFTTKVNGICTRISRGQNVKLNADHEMKLKPQHHI